MSHKTITRVLLVVGAISISACGQGPTPVTFPSPPPPPPPPPPPVAAQIDVFSFCGTSTADASTTCTTPPTRTGGANASGFLNTVEVYHTASAASRAIIFLHGAGGSSCGMAHDLGLYANDVAPQCNVLNSDADGTWLSQNNVIAVFPQGQSLPKNGKTPAGSATWNNWVMDSGQDDMSMLQALTAYVKTNYNVSSVYLVGHSNGGMMANRVWCEAPTTFDGYVALSGPASTHYLQGNANFGAQCQPEVVQPYYAIDGAEDIVLCDWVDATAQCDGLYNGQTWTLSPSITDDSGFITYNNTVLIGEYYQQQARIGMISGCNEQLGPGTPDQTPTPLNVTWTNCNGVLKLQQVVNASHWISYLPGSSTPDPQSLEIASGAGNAGSTGLLDVYVMPFLNGIGTQ